MTINILGAVAAGTHLYEMKHVGLTDKSKGGWHVRDTSGTMAEFHVMVNAVNSGATKVEGVVSDPFYIGRKEKSSMTF